MVVQSVIYAQKHAANNGIFAKPLSTQFMKNVWLLMSCLWIGAIGMASAQSRSEEQYLTNLSRTKWRWMANKQTDSLERLFHEKSMFVHMGGNMDKTQELSVIKEGRIWYKQAEVYSVSVRMAGGTAIVLSDIDLVAVVGGNEVVNPFTVTEVFVKEKGQWKLGSLTFSRLSRPVRMSHQALDINTFLSIREQGSFAVGGGISKNPGTFNPYQPTPEGQTYRGDHAYVFYQIPANARRYPLVMWHGFGQSSKTWETTPDGREGFQNIFLRRRFPVYLIDQPRRGKAARGMAQATVSPIPEEQQVFGTFRLGIWPNFFEGVQFSRDSAALNQFFRQIVPNIGPIDISVNVKAVSELLNKTGAAVLVTHSHSGGMGWLTAIENPNVKGIVSYEPGSGFVFPEGEVPAPMPSSAGTLEAVGIPMADFMKLTKIPIVIYYGDYIPQEPSPNPGQDNWRVRLEMAKKWRDCVNRYGGDVTVVHLPEIGIRGNTHFPFSDLNNVQLADLMSQWLNEKGLDK